MTLVSPSGYEPGLICRVRQVLYEDESQPRISETLMLWESIANSSWLKRASFVLFLNKRDILEEKLRLNPTSFSALLPDYLGPSGDIESIKHSFLVKFTALHRKTVRSLFTSFTSVRPPLPPRRDLNTRG